MEALNSFPWAMVTAGLLGLSTVSAILAPWIAKKLAQEGLVTRRQYERDQKLRIAHEHRRDDRIKEYIRDRDDELMERMMMHLQQRLQDLGYAGPK